MITRKAAGVSAVSWSAYLVSAVVWFWYGLQRRDKNIYFACIGWIVLDTAVILGIIITHNESAGTRGDPRQTPYGQNIQARLSRRLPESIARAGFL
jgi:hypothetical protein